MFRLGWTALFPTHPFTVVLLVVHCTEAMPPSVDKPNAVVFVVDEGVGPEHGAMLADTIADVVETLPPVRSHS